MTTDKMLGRSRRWPASNTDGTRCGHRLGGSTFAFYFSVSCRRCCARAKANNLETRICEIAIA
jgi:hypothetical protein